jgi:rSAM/selenodomain-associated transferase 1
MRAKSCSPCSIFHHSPLTARSPESTSRLRRTPIPAIAVFARAPIAGHAKTRLIPLLSSQEAAGLQAALISDTLRKVAGLRRWAWPYLFWAGSPITFGRSHAEAILQEQPLAGAGISEFSVIRQQGKGLGERLENAFRRLLRLHPSCVVIGTDSPLFPARILRQALRELHACESVLGPCPDGGYYLIALRRPVGPGRLQSIFRRVRWSTAFAFHDTLRNLLRQGLSCSVLEACADVDLPRDLQRLKKNLSRNRTARRLAPATWNFLKRIGMPARPPVKP